MPQFLFEGRMIDAEDGDTVLSALLKHDVALDHGCKAGACQRCLLCTRTGDAPSASTNSLDETLVEQGFFLACQAGAGTIAEATFPSGAAYPSLPATLVHKELLTESVLRLRFAASGLSAKRGRCLRLVTPSGLSRSYSIADMAGDAVEFHVRLIEGGLMSSCLARATVGDSFMLEGPFGKCTYRAADPKPMLLIGSGTGLAPLWGVLLDALEAGCDQEISVFHGAASSDGLYFREELQALAASGRIHYTSCADTVTDSRDLEGSPLIHALAHRPDLTGYRVYLCGHPDLVKTAQKKCFLAGANLGDILKDSFEDQSDKEA